MIFFSTRSRKVDPRTLIERLLGLATAITTMPAGPERHVAAVRALLETGELSQGLADEAFLRRGHDDVSHLERLAASATLEAARLLLPPTRGAPASARGLSLCLHSMLGIHLPESIAVSEAEGHAHHAVFPEAFVLAGRELCAARPGPIAVIGLRSIGTSVGAALAAGADAGPPRTVRATGEPARPVVSVGPALESELLAYEQHGRFAIVGDAKAPHGCGLDAMADWLEDRGVSRERIEVVTGRGAPADSQRSPRDRERLARAARHVVPFERLLETRRDAWAWVRGARSIEDVSDGKWRAKLFACTAEWPPVAPAHERRKYLVTGDGGTTLSRFAGLGERGERALARARVLATSGLVPAVHGLSHGFLVGEWLASARPLGRPIEVARDLLVDRVGDYLATLAREFPVGPGDGGAPPQALLEMARVNTTESLGPALADELDRLRDHPRALADSLRYVATDNKMQPWEWLALPDGRLLKTDALDHHAGLDLVGPQDVGWDVVGATIELDLSEAETERLERRIAALSPYRPSAPARELYTVAYLAFRLGWVAAAAGSLGLPDDGEPERLSRARMRYRGRLERILAGGAGRDANAGT